MKWLFLAPLFLGLLLACGCASQSPAVPFAQSTFTALARGDLSVSNSIDWETLSASNLQNGTTDVAALYLAQPNEKEKADFQNSYISTFAAGFQRRGNSADSFSSWRLENEDSARAAVVGEQGARIVRLTVSKRNGQLKIASISFVDAP